MGDSLIFTGSITYAMKIKDILNKNGVSAVIRKNQSASLEKGCSYGVYVKGNAERARTILSHSDINVAIDDGMEGHDDLS